MTVSARSRNAVRHKRGAVADTSPGPGRVLVADERPVALALALPARPVPTTAGWVLDIVTLDEDGRVNLGDAADLHGWASGVPLLASPGQSWLTVIEAPRRHRAPVVRLDAQNRLPVMLQWRRSQGLAVGSRVCVATGSVDGEPTVAITPTETLAGAVAMAEPFG